MDPRNAALVVGFFISIWLLVSSLIAAIGGWLELGRHYKASRVFDGKLFRFQDAYVRFLTHYGKVVTVGVNDEGMQLAVFFPFRFCHPPLFIPWEDISVRPTRCLWVWVYEFEFRQVPSIRLRLREKLGNKIQEAAGKAWPGDRGATGAAF